MNAPQKKKKDKESGMAKLLCENDGSFNAPLTHEMLWKWHSYLFEGQFENGTEVGQYRTHDDPIQIV